ncbi:hypothetical protein P389DRAFT_181886 [Cystobasidium minutum MCA 4210]|uniref:uncharacterized protein n=1 Tax=Cystobasidium minutum MCA 4210 TaxID=1397322 RepID=UPI0034CDACB8|eukprot:jgi/Rhomi1/181886/fgenesh1_pg.8_\
MSEGGTYASLRQRYTAALSAGENSLRALLGSSSASWKPVQTVTPKPASLNGNEAILSKTEDNEDSVSGISVKPLGPIVIHRKKAKGAPDVVRAVCTVPVTNASNALDSIRAILSTHSLRDKWDPIVEKEEVLEIVEPSVTLVRTFTRIGWPSSARDIVTVNKFLQDPGKTLIYLSVSLPRGSGKTNDDPPFLQPSPPYVRSHMHICAFVVTCPMPNRAKVSMYWQWDLKGSSVVWTNHLSSMPKIISSLVDYTQNQSSRVPFVRSWGKGVTVETETFDSMQDCLDLQYGIFVEEAVEDHDKNHVLLEKSKERRRLERTIEISVPPIEESGAGWNITLPPKNEAAGPLWQVLAERGRISAHKCSRLIIRITHNPPKEDYLPVHVTLQRLAGGKSLKLNGEPLQILDVEERDPTAFTARTINTPMSPSLAKPAPSVLTKVNGLDAGSHASVTTANTHTSGNDEKVSKAQKDLLLLIRRSYAHFLSLLQSPAAKWRTLNDIRRVSVSSYIAIDPAMTPIYKYEATFVNTTMWDLLSVFSSNGSRLIWDRQSALERFHFLAELEVDTMDGNQNPDDESAGEGRASFWEARWKAMWPTAAREAVFVRTTYRSPTSIHLLQTSLPDDEDTVWRAISDKLSAPQEGTFRLHSQLQSVALDQISPTTTSLVLVDQSNPKSWTKSGYNAMANAIANIGDLVLKEGAPPLLVQLSGATLTASSDSHETGTCVLQYVPKDDRRRSSVESVVRLDLDVWSPGGASLTINPPPSRISAIARHRLSEKGSGCWITIEHQDTPEGDSVKPAIVSITVTKASDSAPTAISDRYKLTMNGERIRVDIEELQESEIQARRLQKRIVNRAVMLDRSPTPRNTAHFGRPPSIASIEAQQPTRTATPAPVSTITTNPATVLPPSSSNKAPLDYAFEALARLQILYKETSDARSDASEWTILSYAENNSPIRISKRTLPSLSTELPLYRVERTLPNVSEDQLLRLIQATSSNMRTSWDDRLSSTENIAQYENGFSTSTWIAQGSFPTRSRISYVASARAQEACGKMVENATDTQNPITYVAAASIPVSAFEQERIEERTVVATERLNPSRLLEARILLEGWAIETSSSKKDDEEDDAALQTYTKCSFYTCSELPLMVAGTFGQATLRTRLARIFDTLEKLSRVPTHGAIPRLPRPAVQLPALAPDTLQKNARWAVRQAHRNSTVIAAMPNSIILKLKLQSAGGSTVQDVDAKSLLNGSAISQRSLGMQSLELQAAQDSGTSANGVAVAANAVEPQPSDVLLAELVLQRDPEISGYDIRSTATLPGGKILPTDTSFWNKLSPVPFVARVYPLSGTAKSASQYLMRITLPTSQLISPMEHPLSNLSGTPPLPRWYRKLTAESGIVHLQATPVKAASRLDGMPITSLKFRMDGAEAPLASDSASADFLRERQQDPLGAHLDELIALDTGAAENNVDITNFRTPVVVNTAFLRNAPSRHKDLVQSPGPESPPLVEESPPPAEQETQGKAKGAEPSSPTKPRQPIADLFTTTTVVQQGVKGQPGARAVSVRTYRLAFVILVAVISFLLGSLLRSLLSPGDYIFFTRPLDSMEAAVWELLNPQKKWKFATRLIQFPIPGIKRDFVAALVENC